MQYRKKEINMSTISLRINEEEKRLLENASKSYGCSISSMIKKIVFEKLEDEYAISVAEQAYEAYLKNPKTYSHEDVKELLELE